MKPETVAKYRRAFDLHLGKWSETRIDQLPTVLINEHLNQLQRTMPHGAQYAHGVAGTIIRHAMKVHAIVLPIPSLTDPTSTAKRTVDRDLPWTDRWAEIEAVANVYMRAVWELRWHMGSRENVLRELRWSQVDLDAATVTFARLKKLERPRRGALSDYSHSVFKRLYEAKRSDFVFWSAKAEHVFKLDRLPLTAPGDLRHLWTEAAMSVVTPYHLMRWLNGQNLTGDEIKRECQELCVSATGPFPGDRPQLPSGLKRLSNMMANWLTAVSHPLTPRVVFSCSRMARWISFSAASSEGNEPRVLIALRMTRLRARAAFVV